MNQEEPRPASCGCGFQIHPGREGKAACGGWDPEALMGDPAAGLRRRPSLAPPVSSAYPGSRRPFPGAEQGLMWTRS